MFHQSSTLHPKLAHLIKMAYLHYHDVDTTEVADKAELYPPLLANVTCQ